MAVKISKTAVFEIETVQGKLKVTCEQNGPFTIEIVKADTVLANQPLILTFKESFEFFKFLGEERFSSNFKADQPG